MPPEEKLRVYKALLLKWQGAINLVSASTLKDAESRHFADSAQILPFLPEKAGILVDLGSGAGFPGLVLAILRPDFNIHLIESDDRKCQFLRTVSRETSADVSIHNSRAESVLEDLEPDIITARAFASLDKILGLTRGNWQKNPLLTMILLKGQSADEEIEGAQKLYDFDVQSHPSTTDSHARILILSNIRDK